MRGGTLSPTEHRRPAPTGTALSLLVAGVAWPPERSLARLIRTFGDAGLTVTVACGDPPDAPWFAAPRFRWLATRSGSRSGAASRLGRATRVARAFRRSPADAWRFWREGHALPFAQRLRAWYGLSPFAGQRWDVVYFPDPEAAFAFPPLYGLGRAVVVSAFDGERRAGDLVARLAVARRVPWIFERATRIHCGSNFVLRRLVEGGVAPEKVVVVPPGVDLEFFTPRTGRTAHDEFRLVTTVGAGLSTLGIEHALLAVQRLKRSSVPARLEMLGDCVGEDRHRVLYTIEDLGLLDDVHLRGPLSADATRAVLRAADVFVNADVGTDVSPTALAAMACGLPVVTIDSGGTCETIADRGEGRIVSAWSPEAMARALAELWTDPGSRRRLGAAARRRVADTVPLGAERLLALCRDAARAAA
jgi:glycosyltransferase involved in cell wall biosynthesis